MKVLTKDIGSRRLVHGFHSKSSEDGYEITFETTSVEEYNKVQDFIREKIIDQDERTVLFHCSCGCDFSVKDGSEGYRHPCPKCHTLCFQSK